MTSPSDDLNQIKEAALRALRDIATAGQLENWRAAYLGRKGKVPRALRSVKDLPLSERKAIGKLGNDIRRSLTTAYEQTQQQLLAQSAAGTAAKAAGKTRASSDRPLAVGHLHPLTATLRQVQRICRDLGFQLIEGPNVEEARYNFNYLNIDFEHPARAETDTYYLQDHPDTVLRTHVSPLQIRGVLEHQRQPPLRLMYWGPSYRAEKEDATHGAMFQQYEFLVIDEAVNLADLKAIATTLYSQYFGTSVTIRFRPSYFPFVEPGLEVDMQDTVTGKGGWLEMAGAGMVHPNVLRAMNVDTSRYQGIALGGGLDRLAMLKYGIPDIRLFYAGNLEFLRQF